VNGTLVATSDLVGFVHDTVALAAWLGPPACPLLDALARADPCHLAGVMPDDVAALLAAACAAPQLAPAVTALVVAWADAPTPPMVRFLHAHRDSLLTLLEHLLSYVPVLWGHVTRWVESVVARVAPDHALVARARAHG
jgi:hypothetical protein